MKLNEKEWKEQIKSLLSATLPRNGHPQICIPPEKVVTIYNAVDPLTEENEKGKERYSGKNSHLPRKDYPPERSRIFH
jgi:hypothetical protein